MTPDPADVGAVTAQLGRPPRGMLAVARRCPCGFPDVITTAPRLPDGTPFPTLFYLTCPRASAAASRLESAGMMAEMTRRLSEEPDLRESYAAADRDYASRRVAAAEAAGVAPLPGSTPTAGGMPDRVKCLHALVAHELAVPGSNVLGRQAILAMGPWWAGGPCVAAGPGEAAGQCVASSPGEAAGPGVAEGPGDAAGPGMAPGPGMARGPGMAPGPGVPSRRADVGR